MDYCARESTLCECEAPVRDATLKSILDEIYKMLSDTEAVLTDTDNAISGQTRVDDPRVACDPNGFRDDLLRTRDISERLLDRASRIRRAIF